MQNIMIPEPLQICMDDVGWHNGSDDRPNGGSARSAMPRRHCAEDYAAVEKLGEKLRMRINCGFVLGEWDPDNRLRGVPHATKYGSRWDNAAFLDRDETERCAALLRSSAWIDIAVHGLLHNHYRAGFPYSNTDYYYRDNGRLCMAEEAEIRCRLDTFFSLLREYRIDLPVNSFIPPNFVYRWGEIARILADYGILYVSTPFGDDDMEMQPGQPKPERVGIDGSLIVTDRNFCRISWKETASDPGNLPVTGGIFGVHWPNLLHPDPARHGEVIDTWVSYFRRCADTFGIVLSRDMADCATQSLYCRYAVCRREKDTLTVDASALPHAPGRKNAFRISARRPVTACTGCTLGATVAGNGFYTTEVFPVSPVMTFA